MKTNRKNPFLIAAITLAGIAFTATSAVATPYFWDIDSDTAAGAGGSTPTGSWAALGTTWSTDPTGTAATSAYTTLAADDLTFSAGTDATGSYTVTLGANQDANSLTFEEGAVTLAGNTITLAAGGITVAPGAGDAIIGSALIASGVRIYDVGTGRNLTLNGALGVPVSATSTITKNGAGTMTLGTAAHGIAGNHTVNEGLLITNASVNDSLKGNVVINNGGTMRWTGTRWDNGSQFTINAGGTLNIQATSDLINRVNGAGTITGTGGALFLQGGGSNFSGLISGGMGLRLHSDAAATVTLSNLNTYGGTTTIQRGTLNINSIGNVVVGGPGVPSAIGAPTTVANGTIAMGSPGNTGTLNYTGGAAETDRVINLSSTTGGATLGQNGTGLLKFTSPFTATGIGSKTVTLQGSTAGTGEIAGAIVDNPTVGTTVSTAASTASTSLVLASVDGLTAGNAISGTGINPGTTIVSFDAATKTVTLSANATVATAAVITSAGLVNRTSLTKSGTGTWTLSGNNTYSGTTTGTVGTLLLPKSAVLPGYSAPGKVVFNAGTIGALMGDGTTGWTTAEVDTLLSNATKTSGTLGIDTGNGNLTQWTAFTTTNFVTLGLAKLGANTLTLNAANTYTGATIIREGTLRLSGSGKLGNASNVYSGAISLGAGASFVHAAATQTLSGAITGSGGSVVLDGASSGLILSGGSNSYGSLTMTSIVTGGRLFINNTGALPAAATVAINGGTFVIGAAGTYNAAITAASGVGITARAAATLANVTLPGSGSVVFNNDDTATNLLTISNDQTLTGALTVQVGGNKMTTTTTALGGATLSGKLTGSGSLVVTSGGNPGNVNGLFGSGVLTLSGPNDYNGTTDITGGTLTLGANDVLPDASAVSIGAVTGTATLDAATFDDTLGTLDVTGSAAINLGAGANLAFADSSAIDWTGGTLNLTGTFVSGSSLKFGTTNAALTPAQLGLISATGFTGFGLDASGFLTATVAAGYSSWATLNGASLTNLSEDHDNDGVDNGTEYFIGGPSGNTTGFTPLPGVTNTAGVLSVTWPKAASYTGVYGTDFSVETSATLTGVWATEPSPGTVVVSSTSVTYTFPPGTINFARLKVTGP